MSEDGYASEAGGGGEGEEHKTGKSYTPGGSTQNLNSASDFESASSSALDSAGFDQLIARAAGIAAGGGLTPPLTPHEESDEVMRFQSKP
jgi:hypothetical protein